MKPIMADIDSDPNLDKDNAGPTQVMLYISCSNLPNKDTFSCTDPFCQMWIRELKDPLPPWNFAG